MEKRLFPILLDLKDKKCVVVGGGRVAQRKLNSLLRAGACVYLISPTLSYALKQLIKRNKFFWIKSVYKKSLLKNAFLVIAATNDRKINSRISQDAKIAKILSNVVDSKDESNFIFPAVIQKKDLIISISTSAKVPYLAKRIKEDIKKRIMPRYIRLLGILEAARQKLKTTSVSAKRKKAILAGLASRELFKKFKYMQSSLIKRLKTDYTDKVCLDNLRNRF
jgi:siroheme synthase-like protein